MEFHGRNIEPERTFADLRLKDCMIIDIGKSHLFSRTHCIFWVSTRRLRRIWVRPRIFETRCELLIPSSLRRAPKGGKSSRRTAENRKSGKTRSRGALIYDHWTTLCYPPSRRRIFLFSLSLSLCPRIRDYTNNRTLLRYLAKALPRSRHVHLEDNAARLCARTYIRVHAHTRGTVFANRMREMRFLSRHTRHRTNNAYKLRNVRELDFTIESK